MADNRKISDNLKNLKGSQEAESDNRDAVREADLFLNKRDGQWDPYTSEKMAGKPRYTFDMCNPIVDDIMGEMDSMDFSISVKPAGGDATKETAENYAGIVRNLENISGARYIYKAAARVATGTGLAGWRVVNDYRSPSSFQQDLLIKPLHNFKDRVYFDAGATLRTMEDAKEGWVLTSMLMSEYKKKWPKGSMLSVGEERQSEAYYQKPSDTIIIGEWLHKVESTIELALLSNNSIVEVNEDFEKVRDELLSQGITVERTRRKKIYTVYQSLFDGGDWLDEDKETVFDLLPIAPIYANFGVTENKVIYWGAIEKLMDPQRVLNFAESRKIEEAALSPRDKLMMTKEQATSPDVRATLRTANTNMDAHQLYDHVPNHPPPFRLGKQQPNTVLLETASTAERYMSRSIPDESRGQSVPGRSGFAIQQLINKGNSGSYKYFTAVEIAIAHTCRIIVNAAPRVYDTRQEMTIMAQDGTIDTITIKDRVFDEETGTVVELNDLSKGQYHVACSSGPAFQNRQQESVQGILDIAAIKPDILDTGADILLSNVNAPGIDKLAERERAKLVASGQIPADQLTEDEKALVDQQAEQGREPSPMDQALIAEAEARTREVEAKTADTLSKIEERDNKFSIEVAKLEQAQENAFMKFQDQVEKNTQAETKMILDAMQAQAQQINMMADTLLKLREAQGVDAIVGPATMEAYTNQAERITEVQEGETAPGAPGSIVT